MNAVEALVKRRSSTERKQDDTIQLLTDLLAWQTKEHDVYDHVGQLNAGAVWISPWIDLLRYSSLSIAAKTDQDGSILVQFSPDGKNADSTLTRYYRLSQIEAPHRFSRTRRYGRFTITNTSSSNQTYLRFQAIFGEMNNLNIPLDSVVAQDFDSESVRPTDFSEEVALGRRQGWTTWHNWGYNADVDIGTELVAAQGGSITLLTTATTFTIVSDSANDTAGGTGAQEVTLYYVDANRAAQQLVVVMNGVTPVVTVVTGLGINRLKASLAGSTKSNVGNITLTATTGGSVQAYIPATKGSTQQAMFFTQKNHNLLARWLWVNAEKLAGGTSPKVQFRGWAWNSVTNVKQEIFYSVVDTSVETEHIISPPDPFIIEEQSVFWLEATTDQNNSIVSVRFCGKEVRDVDA
jgi:hypothetical protein